jgi:hypothetical protein
MKVVETYDDGSQTILFEAGDRVRFVRDFEYGFCKTKAGDEGYVWDSYETRRRDKAKHPTIHPVNVRTISMIEGQWGTLSVHPWFIEFIEHDDSPMKEIDARYNKRKLR